MELGSNRRKAASNSNIGMHPVESLRDHGARNRLISEKPYRNSQPVFGGQFRGKSRSAGPRRDLVKIFWPESLKKRLKRRSSRKFREGGIVHTTGNSWIICVRQVGLYLLWAFSDWGQSRLVREDRRERTSGLRALVPTGTLGSYVRKG